MLARYSIRELVHRPVRTALALAGVAVATAMLVDMLMLGSGIQRSFADLLETRGYALRVAPKGTLPFDTEARIDGFSSLRDSLRARPGVAGVAPVLAAAVSLEPVDGDRATGAQRAFALGIDSEEQGILRLVDGAMPRGAEVLLDASTAEQLGIGTGDSVRLGGWGGLGVGAGSRLVASGTAEFLYASGDETPIALELEQLQRLTGRDDAVSFAMVRLDEDFDPAAVERELRALAPRVEIVTVESIVARADERLSYFRQLALILGTVSLLVASLLVGTIMAVSISERLGTIAALRAIGIPRLGILRGLAAESLAMCAVAGAAGLGLGVFVAGYLESILSDFPGLPQAVRFFVLRPGSLAAAYAMLLAVAALAALIPAYRATRLPIATTLHSEEP